MNRGQKVIIFLISFYQKTLSPDHSWIKVFFPFGVCRFHPTCSDYTKDKVTRLGALRGLFLGFKRILKCHPFYKPR
jgi:putative membrane protein insertion efficiency factor